MSTLQNVRSYVRRYLDLEVEDLPDELIDPWVSEGFRRIVRARQEWPAYETTVSLVSDGSADYALDLKEVRSVFDAEYGPLNREDHATAEGRYRNYTGGGRSKGFSSWGGRIRLWPAPLVGRTYTVTGYRQPVDPTAISAGTAFDLPHPDAIDVLTSWVMHKAYLQQDEPELATIHKAQFDEGLAILAKDETDAPPGGPVVLNGSPRRPVLADRLAYPWE